MSVKIHFAGSEVPSHSISLINAQVNNTLYSILPMILKNNGISCHIPALKALKYDYFEYIKMMIRYFSHVIMDSGVYSLILGKFRNKCNEKMIYNYFHQYMDIISGLSFPNLSIVEMDIQNIIGSDKVRELRKKMLFRHSEKDLIFVWHPIDGKKGLDELIEMSSYIAFTSLEKTGMKKDDWFTFLHQLAYYVKSKNDRIKIHLLGCTRINILKKMNDIIDTSDSVSWLQVTARGSGSDDVRKILKFHETENMISLGRKKADIFFNEGKLSKCMLSYIGMESLAASFYKKQYQILGEQ